MNEFEIYSEGLCYMSVCTTLDDRDAIESRAGISGARRGWKIHDGAFANGAPNPCPCDQDSSRMHYLLSC
jgi:hypothetical protein